MRAYYDVHPDRASELTLDPATKNMLRRPAAEDRAPAGRGVAGALRRDADAHPRRVRAAGQADNGRCSRSTSAPIWDHPAGGCRMGTDPATSVSTATGARTTTRTCSSSVADAADGRLHQRHAHLCGGNLAIRGSHRGRFWRHPHGGTTMTRSRLLEPRRLPSARWSPPGAGRRARPRRPRRRPRPSGPTRCPA